MIFERQEHALEFLTCRLEARSVLEVGDGLGVADAGDDILALGINQNALKGLDELLQVFGRKLGINANAGDQARLGQRVLEQVGVDAHNDVGEHLNKAAVAIPGKTRVLRLGDESLNGVVVEA